NKAGSQTLEKFTSRPVLHPNDEEEAMHTVPEISPTRNPKAFYCTFHGLSGVLTKPADHVLFLDPESGAVITVTESDYCHLVVLATGVVAVWVSGKQIL